MTIFFITGCSYFNSFYNTHRNFNEGERERERTTQLDSKPMGYRKAVESGAGLIELYPDSKYIDDALFIMGQSYYWLGEYHKAKRKFEELQTNYPESPYLQQSRLWMGRTYVKMKQRQKATSTLLSLVGDTDDPDLTSGAYFALAELYYFDSLFVKSENEFLRITETAVNPKMIGEAYWRAGEAAFREKNFDKSANYLQKALDYELSKSLRFEVSLYYGISLRESGRLSESIAIFKKLIKDKRYFRNHGRVAVELALAELGRGSREEALAMLADVTSDFPRSDESARAYYELGLIYMRTPGEREAAKEALDKARVEKALSEFAMRADTVLTQVKRLDELTAARMIINAKIGMTDKWIAAPANPSFKNEFSAASYYDSLAIDSLQLVSLWSRAWHDERIVVSVDSIEAEAGEESIKPSPVTDGEIESTIADFDTTEFMKAEHGPEERVIVFDPAPVLDSLAWMRAELQDIRFQLGELLLFDLNEPDSAITIFQELADPPNADSVRARAILALAYIEARDQRQANYDSLMNVLATEFKTTGIGTFASDYLGMNDVETTLTPEELAFIEAESLLLGEPRRAQEAFTMYRWLAEIYPRSAVAPKALYASAFIAGIELDDSQTAEALFNELVRKYPGTKQAVEAEYILGALQNRRQTKIGADSMDIRAESGRFDAYTEADVDEVPRLIGGHEALASILETRNLLPAEVISGTGGEVRMRYLIDSEGHAKNFRVLLEDPPGRGLARALIMALEDVTFQPAKVDNVTVQILVEHSYTLPLDAPPNIRPLPRRRRL